MRYPSIQMLRGVLDDTAGMANQARLVGPGRPEKDTSNTFLGAPATLINKDCAVLLDPGTFPMGNQEWTLQVRAQIFSWTPILGSANYPKEKDEFLIAVSPTYVYVYRYIAPGYNVLYAYGIIPPELRGGFRHYSVVCTGTRVNFYVDGTVVYGVKWVPNAPSNQVLLMGAASGDPETITYSSISNTELVRLDVGYAGAPEEFYEFKSRLNVTEAFSMFDPESADLANFDIEHIASIRNYAPDPTPADLIGKQGEIEDMLADVQGIYTLGASSAFSASFPAWKAFRKEADVDVYCWVSGNVAATVVNPHWIEVKSTDFIIFNAFRVLDRIGGTGRILDFQLLGRDDTADAWTEIAAFVEGDYDEDDADRYFMDLGIQKWKQLRLNITKNYVVDAAHFAAIGKLQFYLAKGASSKKIVNYSSDAMEVIAVDNSTEVGNHIATLQRENMMGVKFDSYMVKNRTWGNPASIQSIKNWTLEGRNDPGDAWTTIDTQTDQFDNVSATERTYTLAEAVSFKEVRIYITATNGTNSFTSIGELELRLDGVNQLTAMTSNSTGDQTSSASSHYTANGVYPPYMAFNQIEDGGWVSASQASPSSPQWLMIFKDREYEALLINTSDSKVVDAGAIVDDFQEWAYPSGTEGYLIDDAGTLKFVPVTINGADVVDGTEQKLITGSVGDGEEALKGNAYLDGAVAVASNSTYGGVLGAQTWTKIDFNVALNGTPLAGTDTFTLAAGKYYGNYRVAGIGGGATVTKIAKVDGTIVAPLNGGHNEVGGVVCGKTYFELTEATELAIFQWLFAASSSDTSKTTADGSPCQLMEMNLYKVD